MDDPSDVFVKEIQLISYVQEIIGQRDDARIKLGEVVKILSRFDSERARKALDTDEGVAVELFIAILRIKQALEAADGR